jgi:non-specific serine/threonine protein kinase
MLMTSAEEAIKYRFGRFELLPNERQLVAAGAAVHLGPHAFDLLVVLVERSGHLVTKDELLQRVWGKVIVEENTLQTHVSALRKMLGADAIATVSGQGYRFSVPVDRVNEPGPAPNHNLPHALTSFIGREKELTEVGRLLSTTPLLTLTGSGGCGKTRFALELAGRRASDYADGAWLVELAALADPALIPQAIANVLHVKEEAGRTLWEGLEQHLSSRRLLLILDNGEHLLDGCAQAAERLLTRCAALTILCTSRERLAMAGELTYRVPSLTVPDESVRLFVDRACLQQHDFSLTDDNASTIVSICTRLDGVALAIELAAPLVRSMSLFEIERRLDERFLLLTGGSRTALPRHRTLRSLIDWSYELLDEPVKVVLRRAAVFSGGWTLDAATAVCSSDGIAASEVLPILTALGDKNLILANIQGSRTRYGMLETVRHYAQEHLRRSGEEACIRQRHFEYFLGRADEGHRHEVAVDSPEWIEYLDSELHNFRAALSAACGGKMDRARDAVRLVGLLYWFWMAGGYWTEAEEWISRSLKALKDVPVDEGQSRVLRALGGIALLRGDYRAAKGPYERSLEIELELGNRRQVVVCLYNLAVLADREGETDAAVDLTNRALPLSRALDDQGLTPLLLALVGWLRYTQADYAEARVALNESLGIWRRESNWRTSYALSILATVAHAEGDYLSALAMAEEALADGRRGRLLSTFAESLIILAKVAIDTGQLSRAAKVLVESIEINRTLGSASLCNSLDAGAAVAAALGDSLVAARIWGVASKAAPSRRFVRLPNRLWNERKIQAARRSLADDEAFDRAWREGHAMDRDEGVRFAVSTLSGLVSEAPAA